MHRLSGQRLPENASANTHAHNFKHTTCAHTHHTSHHITNRALMKDIPMVEHDEAAFSEEGAVRSCVFVVCV